MPDRQSAEWQIFRVAQLYFEQHLTQEEIERELGISQTNVSRLLKKARDSEWLKIRVEVQHPFGLEMDLKKAFGLADCRVASTEQTSDPHALSASLGATAAEYLRDVLKEQQDTLRIGLSGGWTMVCMLQALPKGIRTPAKVEFYSLLSTFATQAKVTFMDSNVIVAHMLDRVLDAAVYSLPLPPFISSAYNDRTLVDAVRECKVINDVLQVVEQDLDLVFTGLGYVPRDLRSDRPFLHFANTVDPDSLKTLGNQRAIGDITFIPFNTLGPIEIPSLERARVGISWNALRRMTDAGKRVVLAAGGKEKCPVLYELLSNPAIKNVLNVFITDAATAQYLLNRQAASRSSEAEFGRRYS